MSANDKQVAGGHYQKQKIQHWDYVAANELDYFQGQITKYVSRHKDKNGLEDLRKAQHFLEKYIETLTDEQSPAYEHTELSAPGERKGNAKYKALRPWFPWDGKLSPGRKIPGMLSDEDIVDVQLRDDTIVRAWAARLRWGHMGAWGDILAYRIVESNSGEPRGRGYVDQDGGIVDHE